MTMLAQEATAQSASTQGSEPTCDGLQVAAATTPNCSPLTKSP